MQIDIDQIKSEIFKSIPKHLVANIIAENNTDLKITDRLIESYLELSLSNEFTVDKTINEIRKLNKFNQTINDKLIFKLNDNSKVAISEETLIKLQENIKDINIITFMKQSKQNFCGVVAALEE